MSYIPFNGSTNSDHISINYLNNSTDFLDSNLETNDSPVEKKEDQVDLSSNPWDFQELNDEQLDAYLNFWNNQIDSNSIQVLETPYEEKNNPLSQPTNQNPVQVDPNRNVVSYHQGNHPPQERTGRNPTIVKSNPKKPTPNNLLQKLYKGNAKELLRDFSDSQMESIKLTIGRNPKHGTKEEKRIKLLMRQEANRRYSKIHRNRKEDKIVNLEKEIENLKKENEFLQNKIKALTFTFDSFISFDSKEKVITKEEKKEWTILVQQILNQKNE